MSLRDIVWWIVIAVSTTPIWGSLFWFIYESYVRPARIPKSEIESLAHEMYRRNPRDPVDAAFTEEQAAWYRSDMFEQGKWRRVRTYLDSEERRSRQ